MSLPAQFASQPVHFSAAIDIDELAPNQEKSDLLPIIQASWQRSLLTGLRMDRAPSAVPHASTTQLAMLMHARQQLVAHACPEMRRLGQRMRKFDGILMLADVSGIVLCSMGDHSFAETAARVALRAGANWSERWRGTNAIGTVIATGAPVRIDGMEHYMSSNGFLTCAAAPVRDAKGQIAGVLNASTRHGSLSVDALKHVCENAARIEMGMFMSFFAREKILLLRKLMDQNRFPVDGLMAISENGRIVGANHAAELLTGLMESEIGKTGLEDLFDVPLHTSVFDEYSMRLLPPKRRQTAGELQLSFYRNGSGAVSMPLTRITAGLTTADHGH